MSIQLRYVGLAALALVTPGCVGYNQTLFMTKSNAGLDFDVKPPTAEINVSRKEGVVAPAFEGGQTPPVMASFGSKSGSGGGLGRFFFGVDQTFAGGDAAVTMAELYNHEQLPPAGMEFESELELSKLPNANQPGVGRMRRFLFGLPEPGEVKPFVFGTDTQLGVKVGWTGVGGPYPETVRIGFNRKEVAVAPVTLIKGADNDPANPHRVEMPSFLATVDTDVAAGGDVQVSWMQYFATGKSASELAKHPGVRAAMIQRADPLASLKATEIAARNLAKKKEEGERLADLISAEIDRLQDGQLNEAVDALRASGLLETDQQADELKAIEDSQEKRDFLKRFAQGLESPDDVAKLNAYLGLLKTIH